MELKELLKGEKKDTDAIKKKMDEVNELVQKLSTELYQKAGQQYQQRQQQQHGQAGQEQESNEGETEPTSKKDENIVDADYEVKDEGKKKRK